MAKVRINFEMQDTVRDELVAAICWEKNYQPTITVQEEKTVTQTDLNGEEVERVVIENKTVDNPVTPAQFAMSVFLKYGQDFIEKKRQDDAWKASVIATKIKFDEEITNNPNITVSAEEINDA